ncbi:hypothetical protein K8R04_02770 [Candidatus Uhrbacteria bacterium]|nr:hypothetical protein [Candidatus Uhrbacteria bacterium]
MDSSWVIAFFLGALCGAVPITIAAVYLFKKLLELMKNEFERQHKQSKAEFENLVQKQKEAYLSVIRTRTDVVKRPVHLRTSAQPKNRQDATVVHADFRNKAKKDPDDSGPNGAA